MKEILHLKVEQCFEFNNALRETGGRLLEENTKNSYWGRGHDGASQNRLCVLLMQLRQHLPTYRQSSSVCNSEPSHTSFQPGHSTNSSSTSLPPIYCTQSSTTSLPGAHSVQPSSTVPPVMQFSQLGSHTLCPQTLKPKGSAQPSSVDIPRTQSNQMSSTGLQAAHSTQPGHLAHACAIVLTQNQNEEPVWNNTASTWHSLPSHPQCYPTSWPQAWGWSGQPQTVF